MDPSIADLLSRFFGARDDMTQLGLDREIPLQLTLREAAEGCRKRVEAQRRVRCRRCSGSGMATTGQVETCMPCSGQGRTVLRGEGRTLSMTCEHCKGKGTYLSHRCAVCGGRGRALSRDLLDVDVPPGIEDGKALRLRGKGDEAPPGPERPDGDLLLRVVISDDELLRREGDDIWVDVSVDADTAEEGGTVRVPGLHGPVKVTIPAGTRDGDTVRLDGHGAVRFGSPARPPPIGEAEAGPYRGGDDRGDHRGALVARVWVEPRKPRKATRIALAATLAAAAATALALLM